MSTGRRTFFSPDEEQWGGDPLNEMKAGVKARRERMSRLEAEAKRRLLEEKAANRKPPRIVWEVNLPAAAAAPAAPARSKGIDPVTQTVLAVIQHVAADFGLTPMEIIAHRRAVPSIMPRHIAMFLAAELSIQSITAIARIFGGRDHSTIIHGRNKIAGLVKTDEAVRDRVARLRAELAEILRRSREGVV